MAPVVNGNYLLHEDLYGTFTDPLFSTLSRITLVTLVTLLVTLLSVTALEL